MEIEGLRLSFVTHPRQGIEQAIYIAIITRYKDADEEMKNKIIIHNIA